MPWYSFLRLSLIFEVIRAKINDKRKKEDHGIRSYEANEAVRCYRDVHNVDIHNQFLSYGHCDYRTRRKQMRVPIVIWFMKLYMLRLASRFSTHMLLSTPLLRGETSNSKTSQKKSAHIENTVSDKHAWTWSKNGPNFAVAIIKRLYLTKRNEFDW